MRPRLRLGSVDGRLALYAQVPRGAALLAGHKSHVHLYEAGSPAVVLGAQCIQVANARRSHYTDEKPHIIAYLDSRCIRLWLTQVVFVVYHSSLCIIVAA